MKIDLTGLVLPERVETASVSEDGRAADFVMEPLERGYGHTLGNSVRRVLLSSLPGSAIWGFRMDGVLHEHQTIPSVVEDVHQIIQNLKSLVVALDEDVDDAVLTVRTAKAGPVTAAKINAPGSVTIHDRNHHIFTLQENREINIELHVNKGRGFVLADEHQVPSNAADLVRIDAIYNPVRRANFTVEETRVGQRTDFDRLTIRVETDGSVTPDAAVQYAAELVKIHLSYVASFSPEAAAPPRRSEPLPVSERVTKLIRTPIDDLAELSVRSRNSFQKTLIKTVGDLVSRTEEQMLEIENFGKKSLAEISDFLEERGLRFGMKWEERGDGTLVYVEDEVGAGAGH